MKPMQAANYAGQDPAGRWLSEKLNGVRGRWDGANLYTKTGKLMHPPAAFRAGLPTSAVEGELYLGRNRLQEVAGLVALKRPTDLDWASLRFHLFDAPDHPGTFEERQAFLHALALPAHVVVIEQIRCAGRAHADAEFERLTADGAEGLMFAAAGSHYSEGVSDNLWRWKKLADAEAEVIGYAPGLGRLLGKVGALVCRWGGQVFKVGSGLDDRQRNAPPPLGSLITFAYYGLTNSGRPNSPVFLAVRDYE
jgi:DNA ligase-1